MYFLNVSFFFFFLMAKEREGEIGERQQFHFRKKKLLELPPPVRLISSNLRDDTVTKEGFLRISTRIGFDALLKEK